MRGRAACSCPSDNSLVLTPRALDAIVSYVYAEESLAETPALHGLTKKDDRHGPQDCRDTPGRTRHQVYPTRVPYPNTITPGHTLRKRHETPSPL